MNTLQDRTRGSLIGGAIGDALGYPVEFKKTFEEIQRLYGERGITRLIPQKQRLDDDDFSDKAVISDICIEEKKKKNNRFIHERKNIKKGGNIYFFSSKQIKEKVKKNY